jgi:hypothetical protein
MRHPQLRDEQRQALIAGLTGGTLISAASVVAVFAPSDEWTREEI